MSSTTSTTESAPRKRANTVPAVRATKVSEGSEPLVMVTAYDAPSARIADEAEVDMILVGDSVAMVVLGYDDTLQLTVDDMAHHIGAVARTKPDALIVADMPWMSFHVSVEQTIENAAKLIRAGGQCVKIEGGTKRVPVVRALVDAEIPVMGHLGLTPQSTHAMGGFKVQARQLEAAEQLLQDAGVFAIVLEGIPDLMFGVGNVHGGQHVAARRPGWLLRHQHRAGCAAHQSPVERGVEVVGNAAVLAHRLDE